MGYEGRLTAGPERARPAHAGMEKLVATWKLIESHGIPLEIVTAGGMQVGY
jgi:hypothetical protein